MINYILRRIARVRYLIRKNWLVAAIIYMVPNFIHAVRRYDYSPLGNDNHTKGVAICLRFRDEAIFLKEWLDYYIHAGVDHFYLYNNFSSDDYQSVLRPYELEGLITLIDWPFSPASPSAENDCIKRTRGLFRWVGFIDADEFVVVQDGISIPDYLNQYTSAPAVALHWYYFGSNGHKERPADDVIRAYTRRASKFDMHFKVFVRPEEVTQNRNSHNFYYRRGRCAIQDSGKRVFGSMALPSGDSRAWINHYFFKSEEDYLMKAARRSTLDKSGIREPSRRRDLADVIGSEANEVEDLSAISYLDARRAARLRLR